MICTSTIFREFLSYNLFLIIEKKKQKKLETIICIFTVKFQNASMSPYYCLMILTLLCFQAGMFANQEMLDPDGVMISNLITSRKNDGKDSISLWALTHDKPLWKKARSMSTMRNPHTVTSLTAEEWYSSSASALGIWNFTYMEHLSLLLLLWKFLAEIGGVEYRAAAMTPGTTRNTLL